MLNGKNNQDLSMRCALIYGHCVIHFCLFCLYVSVCVCVCMFIRFIRWNIRQHKYKKYIQENTIHLFILSPLQSPRLNIRFSAWCLILQYCQFFLQCSTLRQYIQTQILLQCNKCPVPSTIHSIMHYTTQRIPHSNKSWLLLPFSIAPHNPMQIRIFYTIHQSLFDLFCFFL